MRPKTKHFAVKFRRILEVFPLDGLQEKILGTFSRFMHAKAKLFTVMLKCIWEVFALQGL